MAWLRCFGSIAGISEEVYDRAFNRTARCSLRGEISAGSNRIRRQPRTTGGRNSKNERSMPHVNWFRLTRPSMRYQTATRIWPNDLFFRLLHRILSYEWKSGFTDEFRRNVQFWSISRYRYSRYATDSLNESHWKHWANYSRDIHGVQNFTRFFIVIQLTRIVLPAIFRFNFNSYTVLTKIRIERQFISVQHGTCVHMGKNKLITYVNTVRDEIQPGNLR